MVTKTKCLYLIIALFLVSGCAKMAWKQAGEKNTVSSYREYLNKYPNSEFTSQASDRIEDLIWQQMQSKDDVKSYNSYIKQYPSGKHLNVAEKRIEEIIWTESQKTNSIKSYNNYLKTYSQGKYATLARDKIEVLFWGSVEKEDTIESYRKYISQYPGGKYLGQAKDRIETIFWNKRLAKNTSTGYQEYITEYPNGTYVDQANSKIEQLDWNQAQRLNSAEGYETYLKKYPQDNHSLEAQKKMATKVLFKLVKSNQIENMEQVKKMIDEGADISVVDKDGANILHWAAVNDNTELLQYMLDNGGNINVKISSSLTTPLHLASYYGKDSFVNLLIQNGVNVNEKDKAGKTALGYAASRVECKTMSLLLKHGATLDGLEIDSNREIRDGIQFEGYQKLVKKFVLQRRCDISGKKASFILQITPDSTLTADKKTRYGADSGSIRVLDGSETRIETTNDTWPSNCSLKCGTTAKVKGFMVIEDDKPFFIEFTNILIPQDKNVLNSMIVAKQNGFKSTDISKFKETYNQWTLGDPDNPIKEGDAIFKLKNDKTLEYIE